jgi:hypothetical protein
MNVRLQYDLEFLAGVYYEDQLQMNQYNVSLNLLTKTKDSASTNIALDRAKAFVHGALENTVFINQNNMERAEFMQMIGINVTTLPEEPVDQIIGMMLYYKLNAIMEGRMLITQLDLSSHLGDGVWYQHDDEDPIGPFAAEGWWHDNSLKHNTLVDTEAESNIVKVLPNAWVEYGLMWPGEHLETASAAGNTVVFGNFPKQ